MTTFTWNVAAGGAYNTSGDWNQPGVPGSGDDAILPGFSGTPYTVTLTSSASIHSIQTAANATLSITTGTYTDSSGTGVGVNAGVIAIGNSGVFNLTGAFDNTGAVNISSYNQAELEIGGATSLTGGGQINLVEGTYAASNLLQGATAGTTLTNVDNTIAGAGQLGGGQLTLVNETAGVIDATGSSHQLVLNTGSSAVSNSGLIEDTGSAGLLINGTTINNASTGVIEANGSGAHVDLQSSVVTGGTLKTLGGGVIDMTDRGSIFDGTTSAVTNQGMVDIAGSGTTLSLKGSIVNSGTLSVTSYNASQLVIAANTTLTGTGQVTLNEGTYAASNQLVGAAAGDTLTNFDNTISGAGALGAGQLTLVNDAAGIIEATGSSHQLILNTGASVVTNAGLIEATGTAGLSIVGTTVNDSTGGSLLANNSVIDLQSADIVGGALNTMGTGSIQTADRGSVLDGTGTHKIYMLGNLTIGGSGTSLTIDGSINLTKKVGATVTNGVITITSYNPSQLIVGAKNATLTGSQVDMAEGTYAASNQIIGTATTKSGKTKLSKLSNSSTIIGAGSIGSNLILSNSAKGVIDATGSSHALVIQTGSGSVAKSNVVKNSGLIESTNPTMAGSVGGLEIANTVISNSGPKAIVEANGSATHVDLLSATIVAGTLETLNGGIIQTLDRGSVLDGSTLKAGKIQAVDNKATIDIAGNGTSLSLKGSIVNTGTFSLTSYNPAQLIMATNTTLSGGGAVNMNEGTYAASNQVYGATAATSLTNVDNTISGAGALGLGQLTLINEAAGVIDATGGSHQLVISTGSVAVSNAGLIEATGSAGLQILATTISNSATGVVKAAGSHVDLTSATIAGGTLSAASGGYFDTTDHGSVLDGTTATANNQATIDIAGSGTALSLKGAIDNTGTFSITSYNPSQLIMAANTTLSGGGAVTLNEGTYAASNQVYGATAATTLTNVDNTISGAGQLGAGQLTLVNDASGVIDATGTSHALVVNPGAGTVSNAGLMEATASAGLSIQSAITNTGNLQANGGNVAVSGAITGAGTDTIEGSSTFEAGAADSNNVTFAAGSTGVLKLDQSQSYTGVITGLATGKTIDLANISFSTAHIVSYAGNVLTVTDGTTTATLALSGAYQQGNFQLSADSSSHTNLTYNGSGMASVGVAQMASAMAAMGSGAGGSAAGSSVAQAAPPSLLTLPHAA
jgi:hypothetical protein